MARLCGRAALPVIPVASSHVDSQEDADETAARYRCDAVLPNRGA
jgi:hypothetical protein